MSALLGGRSLGGRLTVRLALQSLVGLTALSLFVFVAIDAHLTARQERTLDEMQALVLHLVAEASTRPRAMGLEHTLRDQFRGREDAHLEIVAPEALAGPRADDTRRSTTDAGHVAAPHVRTRTFELPGSAGVDGAAFRARMTLASVADDELLGWLALTLAGTVALGTLIVSAATFWRVRRELAPLERLVVQVNALDASRLDRRIESTGQPSELSPLIERVNGLLDRLDLAYRQMAAFNADVAHELNTPLATLITGNEIACRDTLSPDQSRELIGSNLEELRRLGGIVRDMLFLSTAERGAKARTTHVPSLAAEVRGVLDYHEASLEDARLEAVVHGDVAADIDVPLMRRAMSNLVGNATRHARPGTRVDVHIEPAATGSFPLASAPHGAPGTVRLTVSNRGPTVASHHLARLFERFYQVEDSSRTACMAAAGCSGHDASDRGARHGLGLTIVAAVARMHGGTTFARSEDGLTAIGFTLEPSDA